MDPLFEAVLANGTGDIELLLAQRPGAVAEPIPQDTFVAQLPHWLYRGDTALHLAAAGLRVDAAQSLLASGAPADPTNRRGAAPLHYACDPRSGSGGVWDPVAQRRMIQLLVDHGAAVDRADRGGVTALHRAVRARSPVATAALLEAGADPLVRTKAAGSTPLHLAVAPTGASGTAGEFTAQVEIARLLLSSGARLDDSDGSGRAVRDRIRSAALRAELLPA